MENFYINHFAVFVCALMSLVIGGFWWSPLLFAKMWQRETGLADDDLKSFNPLKTFGLTFLLAYLSSYNLAFFLGDPATTWKWGVAAGLLAAFWAIAMFVIIGLFERRTFLHLLIDCGYIAVYFAACGLLLGMWR
ncbi:MAG: DUF1761 domain-containing protein [Acidobacteria bacterium]|nr:DUF1761 domain-containing protein [Acidobacteriota bacterium]MBK8813095.1 DUF1761 domain-containing protein [Acidobacteriota bacterium]